MGYITVTCPACGEMIKNLEDNKEKYFCPYCGKAIERSQTPAQPTTSSLLIRGRQYLERGNWSEGYAYFNRVLDIDPTCVEAYLGLVNAEYHFHNNDEAVASDRLFEDNSSFRYAQKYAGSAGKALVEPYIAPERLERIRKTQAREKEEVRQRQRDAEIAGLQGRIAQKERDIKRDLYTIGECERGISRLNTRIALAVLLKIAVFAAVWYGIKRFLGLYDSVTEHFFTVINVLFVLSLIGLIVFCVIGAKRGAAEINTAYRREDDGLKLFYTKNKLQSMLESNQKSVAAAREDIRNCQEKLKSLQ